jgi:hypothetical protein
MGFFSEASYLCWRAKLKKVGQERSSVGLLELQKRIHQQQHSVILNIPAKTKKSVGISPL